MLCFSSIVQNTVLIISVVSEFKKFHQAVHRCNALNVSTTSAGFAYMMLRDKSTSRRNQIAKMKMEICSQKGLQKS
jgi:hypothetical protein